MKRELIDAKRDPIHTESDPINKKGDPVDKPLFAQTEYVVCVA